MGYRRVHAAAQLHIGLLVMTLCLGASASRHLSDKGISVMHDRMMVCIAEALETFFVSLRSCLCTEDECRMASRR